MDLTQVDLGQRAGVDRRTVMLFESGARNLMPHNANAIRHELERAGVEFLDDERPGVRIAANRAGEKRMAS